MSDGEECGYALYIVSFYMDIELWPKLFSKLSLVPIFWSPKLYHQPQHETGNFLYLSSVDVDLIRIRQLVRKDHCY